MASEVRPPPASDSPSDQSLEDKILAGVIGAPHGLKGEVKFSVRLDNPELIHKEGVLYTREGTPFSISQHRKTAKGLVLGFDNTPDREAAEALRGTELYLNTAALPPLEEGAFYYKDLVGLAVKDHSNASVGCVMSVFYSGAQHILVIQDGGHETLIPFVDDTIAKITDTTLHLTKHAQLFFDI